jgi:hypothetical protein
MTERPIRRGLAGFLPAAVVLTVACGLVFIGLQQSLRMAANDPQQQLAEDLARKLDAGAAPGTVVGAPDVDLAVSLAPFVAVYDPAGTVLAADGMLDGGPPRPPIGVLDAARSSGMDTVTWQPRAGVRIAAVVVPWHGGTVLAGRSLRVVEDRVGQLRGLAAIAWLGGLALLAVACAVGAWLTRVRAPGPVPGQFPPGSARPDS